MNIPNSLTLFRIFLIPVFVIVLVLNIPYGDLLAAIIFIAAALTDSLDGYLARKYKQITKLGIILDPIADKLLITAALICLVQLGRIQGWIAIVILGREFAVSGLRSVKAEEGIIIPASKLGKFKTISQVLAVIIIILERVYAPLHIVGIWAIYIAVAITLISGIDYFIKFKLTD
jgi:CDP-diacylglycerol--glycerol-3-phosphate 3-phosphatidyltransferase